MIVNRVQLAEVLGVTEKSIGRWQDREVNPLPIQRRADRRGQSHEYDTAAVIAWWIEYEISKRTKDMDGEIIDLDRERARLTKEQADGQELKNRQLRGELLESWQVVQTWTAHIAKAKSRLRAIKSKVKTRIPRLSDAERQAIGDLIDDACNELSQDALPDLDDPESV